MLLWKSEIVLFILKHTFPVTLPPVRKSISKHAYLSFAGKLENQGLLFFQGDITLIQADTACFSLSAFHCPLSPKYTHVHLYLPCNSQTCIVICWEFFFFLLKYACWTIFIPKEMEESLYHSSFE